MHPDDAQVPAATIDPQHWLRLRPRSIADAVELGYQAGTLRWRVRYEGEAMLVAIDGPVDAYLDQLGALVTGRRVLSSMAD